MAELILAVDVGSREDVKTLLTPLCGTISWVKVGLQLFTKYGQPIVNEIADLGFNIFLDIKLHDIPNTVASAIKSLNGLPIGMLTIHTLGGSVMMKRAIEVAKEVLPNTQLLGVTVLTSHSDVREIGIERLIEEEVDVLAMLAIQSGITGLVCSPMELSPLRQTLGETITLVSPGIRLATQPHDDQQRTMTPAEAVNAGADYIVVGRPILQATDKLKTSLSILGEMGRI